MRATLLPRDGASSVYRSESFQPRLHILEDRTLLSAFVVDRLTDTGAGAKLAGDFRYCLTQAVDGDTIMFGVRGTINLTRALPDINQNVDIEGPGADLVTIRRDTGGDYRILTVDAGAAVGISGLTLTNGKATDGGGIFVDSATLTVTDSVLIGNVAVGRNGTLAGGVGGNGRGGGLYVAGGALAIAGTTITNNQARGGRGGDGFGFFSACTFIDAGAGGQGQGGGLYAVGSSLSISASTLVNNQVTGGDGGNGISCRTGGGATTLYGSGGPGGASQGAGLYASSGMLTVTDSLISNDTGRGGVGGVGPGNAATGGTSQGGGLYVNSTLGISKSAIANNTLRGGNGGGPSQGGGLYVSGTFTVSNSTIAANAVQGGDGYYSYNSGGAGQGGGLWAAAEATAQVSFSTIATNQATGGIHGSSGGSNGMATGGGLYNRGRLQTRDTLLAGNTVNGPGTNSAPDLFGDLGSLGHNLISNSQNGSGYDATDFLDVDPMLGPLQNNGGPTETMALLPGSPAIDAGDNTDAPDWDQRGEGFPRIVNGIIDIGAFEYQGDGSSPRVPWPMWDPATGLAALATSLLAGVYQPTALPVALASQASTSGSTDRLLPASEGPPVAGGAAGDLWFTSLAEVTETESAPLTARWDVLFIPELAELQ